MLAARQTAGSTSSRSPARPGARGEVSSALPSLVERARRLVGVPLYAGFGISTPEHARSVAELADGIVVGSRALQVAEEGPDALREYVGSLRTALDSQPVFGFFSPNPTRAREGRKKKEKTTQTKKNAPLGSAPAAPWGSASAPPPPPPVRPLETLHPSQPLPLAVVQQQDDGPELALVA